MPLPKDAIEALQGLQRRIGAGNAENGWHDRTRMLQDTAGDEEFIAADLVDHWVATLALIDTEVSEAIEELRNGHAVEETYYTGGAEFGNGLGGLKPWEATDAKGDLRKPEGVPSEVADVVIRAFDFAYRAGFDLAGAIDEKLAYNATRGKMHGGKKL